MAVALKGLEKRKVLHRVQMKKIRMRREVRSDFSYGFFMVASDFSQGWL